MDTTRSIFSISEALYHLIVMMLTLSEGVHSMPVPTDVPMCTATETAQYRLMFTGKWTQAAFPKQYPVYRPPAQWSNLIGKYTASWCQTVLSLATIADVEQSTDRMSNRKLMTETTEKSEKCWIGQFKGTKQQKCILAYY